MDDWNEDLLYEDYVYDDMLVISVGDGNVIMLDNAAVKLIVVDCDRLGVFA